MLKSIMDMCVSIMKWPLIIFFGVVAVFALDIFIFFIIEYKKGRRLNPSTVRKLPRESALKRIFIDAPKMYVEDMYNKPSDFFDPQGMIMFCGKQGRGKTSSVFKYVMDLQYQYSKVKVISNTPYKYQDEALKHWKQLITYKNGKQGVIAVIDETQNWFSSNQSQKFPPEMLTIICQNRKNRRLILGTGPNFYMLNKNIRTQCTEVRNCVTLAGVLTIVIKREPYFNEDGSIKEMKYRGMYFFVHSKELREAYDTWKTVEALSKSGFHDNPFLRENVNINEKAEKK